MRPDRRHELEQNDLADSATAIAERLRPHLRTLGLAAVAVVLGVAAWSSLAARRSAAREESWDAFTKAFSTGQIAAVDEFVAGHAGTPAAHWAGLVSAEQLLDQGSQLLSSDRAVAEQRLKSAADRYAAVLASGPPDFVKERATFGLAKARENLGSLDEARRGYEAVVVEFPRSAVRPMAEARIEALRRESTREWYDWFAKQSPVTPPTADGAAQPPVPTGRPAESGAGATAEPGADRAAEPASGAAAGSGTGAGG